jgi:hypothetical protein
LANAQFGTLFPVRRSIRNAIKEIDMIGKIIGGIAGANAASHLRGIGGPGGALLGVGAASLMRRMSPLGLIALAAGGYAFKRYKDKQEKPSRKRQPKVKPSAT